MVTTHRTATFIFGTQKFLGNTIGRHTLRKCATNISPPLDISFITNRTPALITRTSKPSTVCLTECTAHPDGAMLSMFSTTSISESKYTTLFVVGRLRFKHICPTTRHQTYCGGQNTVALPDFSHEAPMLVNSPTIIAVQKVIARQGLHPSVRWNFHSLQSLPAAPHSFHAFRCNPPCPVSHMCLHMNFRVFSLR